MTVAPADVGRRVSVRRALAEGGVGDVVGELVSWADGVLEIRTRRGGVVRVPEATLVAGKVVPQ